MQGLALRFYSRSMFLSFSRKIFPLSPQAAAICDPLKVGRKGIAFRCPLGWPGATLAADGAKCRRYRAPVFELARFGERKRWPVARSCSRQVPGLARISNASKAHRQGGAIPAPPFPAPPFWGAASTCAASPEQTLHVSRLKPQPQPRARRQLLGQNLRRVGFTLAPSCWPANTGDVPVLLPSMRCSARPCPRFKREQAPVICKGLKVPRKFATHLKWVANPKGVTNRYALAAAAPGHQ